MPAQVNAPTIATAAINSHAIVSADVAGQLRPADAAVCRRPCQVTSACPRQARMHARSRAWPGVHSPVGPPPLPGNT